MYDGKTIFIKVDFPGLSGPVQFMLHGVLVVLIPKEDEISEQEAAAESILPAR